MKRNQGKLSCVTGSGTQVPEDQIPSIDLIKKTPDSVSSSGSSRSSTGNSKKSWKMDDTPDSGKSSRSPKKTSKYSNQSPIKKSQDHLSKLNLDKKESSKSKFTNDISDAGASKVPAIVSIFPFSENDHFCLILQPESEIMEFMIQDDLSEIDRIKALL